MSIPQISPNSVLANPADLNPQLQAAQNSSVTKAGEEAQKAAVESKSDSVTISRQALSKASQIQGPPEETKESRTGKAKEKHAEKAKEKHHGKK